MEPDDGPLPVTVAHLAPHIPGIALFLKYLQYFILLRNQRRSIELVFS
jgi:hypothetical protein